VTFGSLTAQWLGRNEDYVIYQTVPHELGHAVLNDWLGPRISVVPTWFNEGQAMNNQIQGIEDNVARARKLAQENRLERIANMDARANIGKDEVEKTEDWYAQATSLVAYLYERYSLDSLGKIVARIKGGKRFEDAFAAAVGVSLGDFELGWREWLGATTPPSTIAPTPTFNPFPPSPTYEPNQ
jgi:hypothetical protein